MKQIKLQQTNTTEQLIADYIVDMRARGLTEKSIKNNTFSINRFISSDFDMGNLKELYAHINSQTDLSITSRGTYLRAIKTFVKWVNREYNENYPLPQIPHEEVIKPTYSNEDLQKLIAKPKQFKSFCDYRNWLIILTLIDTGIRAATLRNITVAGLDLENRALISTHFKTKKQQFIPISNYLAAELKKYLPYVQENEYLFCDVYGKQLSDDGLKSAIKRYNKSRGVSDTSLHEFRHTFAKRYILDMKGDALMLQKLLGHSTLTMTKHYCNIYDADMLTVYNSTSPLESLQKHKKQL